jgi:hypothetical protein
VRAEPRMRASHHPRSRPLPPSPRPDARFLRQPRRIIRQVQTPELDDTRSSGAGVELAPALPEARPPIRARTSEPAHFGDPTGTVSCGVRGWGVPLAFLATATEAVHHRCITSTAFGGLPRDRGSTRNPMVKPNPPTRRLVGRSPAYRSAKENPCICRYFLLSAQHAVHHPCITGSAFRHAITDGRGRNPFIHAESASLIVAENVPHEGACLQRGPAHGCRLARPRRAVRRLDWGRS